MCGGTTEDIIRGTQEAADDLIRGAQEATDAFVQEVTGSGGTKKPIGISYGTTGGFDLNPNEMTLLTGGGSNFITVTPNLDQDLMAPVTQSIQDINVPRPNLDQDLTQANLADVQQGAIDVGSAVQAQAIESGSAGQQALIDVGSATQTNAITVGTVLTGGQSNPALEQEASNITSGLEGSIDTEIQGAEASIQTEVQGYEASADTETKSFETQVAQINLDPEIRGIEAIPTDFADFNIDLANKFDLSLDSDQDQYSATTTTTTTPLDADGPNLGDNQVFGDLEKATGKGNQLSEEERLRRIRRLLLNRYGRSDTILTSGPGDTKSRRRYAR